MPLAAKLAQRAATGGCLTRGFALYLPKTVSQIVNPRFSRRSMLEEIIPEEVIPKTEALGARIFARRIGRVISQSSLPNFEQEPYNWFRGSVARALKLTACFPVCLGSKQQALPYM